MTSALVTIQWHCIHDPVPVHYKYRGQAPVVINRLSVAEESLEDGRRSILARVSVVNDDGNVILDTFVAPTERVTDFRTKVSGVRPQDIKGAGALSFKEVQRKMAEILKDRVLVGAGCKLNPDF